MSKLSRAIQKIFGDYGGTGEFGKIGSKAAGAAATTKDITTMQELTEYLQGMNAIISDQGTSVLPYLEDFNSLHFLETSQIAYLFQAGIPEWLDSADQRYYQNASIVQVDGDVYLAILGDDVTNINVQKDPTSEPTWWQPIFTKSGSWPIGATYIQFPGDSDPSTLGLPGTWSNVSSELAGDFIRFEGGESKAFNAGQQPDAMQRITGDLGVINQVFRTSTTPVGQGVGALDVSSALNNVHNTDGSSHWTGRISFNNADSIAPNAAKTDDIETRAVNRTVRKWRRTA